jgi:phosphoribosylanthranilate isomerase
LAKRPLLKVCGVTNTQDARLVSGSGADFCGILAGVDFSERNLPPERAKKVAEASAVPVVILMCDPKIEAVIAVDREIGPYAVQLLCREEPDFLARIKRRVSCKLWKTLHLPPAAGQAPPEAYVDAGADALLLDTVDSSEGFVRLGGTGKVADWDAAAAIVGRVDIPVFLAGGIDPDNVAEALFKVRPCGIDLCSGVEAYKGRKDPDKLTALITNFKSASALIQKEEK